MRKRRYDRYVSTTESLLGTHRCDLTSLAETERLVEVMGRDLPTLDYLVLSQGIFSTAGRTETSESHDVKMVLHYYSRMAIIRGLQKNLEQSVKQSGPVGRVVSILDASRGSPDLLQWDNLDLKTAYTVPKAANHAKSLTDIAFQVGHSKKRANFS